MMSPERRIDIERSYSSLQPFVKHLASKFSPDLTMLDVGSGEGLVAVLMAKDFKVGTLHLVDNVHSPKVSLPTNAQFHRMSVSSPKFLDQFQNKVHLVTCINTFHEFEEPIEGIRQLLGVLPTNSMLLLMDNNELGWKHQGLTVDPYGKKHFQEDMVRVSRNGLHTDAGIRDFWEQRCFPGIPGECHLVFLSHVYVVVYIARQWYEVKEPPASLKAQVDAYLQR